MIYLFHGEDQLKSRQTFYQVLEKLKTPDTQIKKSSYPKIDPDKLDNFVNTSSLFETKKLLLLNNFLSLPAPKLNPILALFEKNPDLNVLLWESKTATPAKIKKLVSPKAFYFPVPKTIFRFLDSLKPKNKSIALKLLHETLETQAAELINYFLKDHLRLLIMAQDKDFHKVNKFPSWRQSKLINQSKLFSPQKLKDSFNLLVENEYQKKTGQLDTDLAFHLTLFIISLTL